MNRPEEILTAINAELEKASRPKTLHVVESIEQRAIWEVQVKSPGKLNDTQEGWRAWWRSGTATVLSLRPDDDILNLQFVTGSPPKTGEIVQLYPPLFLEELRELWKRPSLAGKALEWFDSVMGGDQPSGCPPLIPSFRGLRKAQKEAFRLPSFACGYLWGPPGTGKTFTVGALLADYLRQFPNARVLLLSNANSAVDQAIVSVDKSVDELIARDPKAGELRGLYLRMGVHFRAGEYLGREYLLPITDPATLSDTNLTTNIE